MRGEVLHGSSLIACGDSFTTASYLHSLRSLTCVAKGVRTQGEDTSLSGLRAKSIPGQESGLNPDFSAQRSARPQSQTR